MSEPQSTPDFPEPDVDVESIDPETLKARIDDGEPVTILDTRMESDFEDWAIEGDSVETINRPYYEFLDGEVSEEDLDGLPEDQRLTVVCAKGEASDYVAGLLAEEGYEVEHLAEGMNGWASIYEAYELETAGDATVVQYQRPSSGCLAYLVVDGDEAAVVDPLRYFAERYVEDARDHGAELTYAIDTHIHADHVSGVRKLAREHDVTAVVPEQSLDRGVDYDVAYETLDDGESLTVGDTDIEAVYTPGHTTGMTSYRVEEFLFTGDGLFTESVARPDLEDGDEGAPDAAAMLYETLQERVLTLPDETVVAPAHFSDAATPADDGSYTATLGELQSRMDALSMDRDEFVEYVLDDMPPRPANYEDIIATNMGQQSADDEEAFELELGPNNCAASRDAMTSDD
jgi:glyoxylase-like metal-dependent hydrolase (beta-lactamase superfamily II)